MKQSAKIYSPKKVAAAIGVSESSLKRWCDAGRIGSFKTAGGHRRMTTADVVQFVRANNLKLKKPGAIGLPIIANEPDSDPKPIQLQLVDNLIRGESEKSRELLLQCFINLWPLERIVDDLISPAFQEIGRRFESARLEIYQERRACEICLNGLREIQSLISKPLDNAPLAIGGSAANDHYTLPTAAVELTLYSHRWNARSLGSNLPFQSFHEAVRLEKPKLLWMSVTHLDEDPAQRQQFQAEINHLAASLPQSVNFVIGGQAIYNEFRNGLKSVVVCDNMSQMIASTKNMT